jgi:hypothetical protein
MWDLSKYTTWKQDTRDDTGDGRGRAYAHVVGANQLRMAKAGAGDASAKT